MTEMDEEAFGDMDASQFEDVPIEEVSKGQKYVKILLPIGILLVILLGVVLVIRKKKKKKAAQEEDLDDEIS